MTDDSDAYYKVQEPVLCYVQTSQMQVHDLVSNGWLNFILFKS